MAKQVPRYFMGPASDLRSEIDRQLLLDLNRAGIAPYRLTFDWSQIRQDGLFHVRQVTYQGAVFELQEYEGLRLIKKDGAVVGDGSYDFVYSGENENDPFYIFWSSLDVFTEPAGPVGIKYHHGNIPDHIWN